MWLDGLKETPAVGIATAVLIGLLLFFLLGCGAVCMARLFAKTNIGKKMLAIPSSVPGFLYTCIVRPVVKFKDATMQAICSIPVSLYNRVVRPVVEFKDATMQAISSWISHPRANLDRCLTAVKIGARRTLAFCCSALVQSLWFALACVLCAAATYAFYLFPTTFLIGVPLMTVELGLCIIASLLIEGACELMETDVETLGLAVLQAIFPLGALYYAFCWWPAITFISIASVLAGSGLCMVIGILVQGVVGLWKTDKKALCFVLPRALLPLAYIAAIPWYPPLLHVGIPLMSIPLAGHIVAPLVIHELRQLLCGDILSSIELLRRAPLNNSAVLASQLAEHRENLELLSAWLQKYFPQTKGLRKRQQALDGLIQSSSESLDAIAKYMHQYGEQFVGQFATVDDLSIVIRKFGNLHDRRVAADRKAKNYRMAMKQRARKNAVAWRKSVVCQTAIADVQKRLQEAAALKADQVELVATLTKDVKALRKDLEAATDAGRNADSQRQSDRDAIDAMRKDIEALQAVADAGAEAEKQRQADREAMEAMRKEIGELKLAADAGAKAEQERLANLDTMDDMRKRIEELQVAADAGKKAEQQRQADLIVMDTMRETIDELKLTMSKMPTQEAVEAAIRKHDQSSELVTEALESATKVQEELKAVRDNMESAATERASQQSEVEPIVAGRPSRARDVRRKIDNLTALATSQQAMLKDLQKQLDERAETIRALKQHSMASQGKAKASREPVVQVETDNGLIKATEDSGESALPPANESASREPQDHSVHIDSLAVHRDVAAPVAAPVSAPVAAPVAAPAPANADPVDTVSLLDATAMALTLFEPIDWNSVPAAPTESEPVQVGRRPFKPAFTFRGWNIHESDHIQQLWDEGHPWDEIVLHFPSRTPRQIQAHWYLTMHREPLLNAEDVEQVQQLRSEGRQLTDIVRAHNQAVLEAIMNAVASGEPWEDEHPRFWSNAVVKRTLRAGTDSHRAYEAGRKQRKRPGQFRSSHVMSKCDDVRQWAGLWEHDKHVLYPDYEMHFPTKEAFERWGRENPESPAHVQPSTPATPPAPAEVDAAAQVQSESDGNDEPNARPVTPEVSRESENPVHSQCHSEAQSSTESGVPAQLDAQLMTAAESVTDAQSTTDAQPSLDDESSADAQQAPSDQPAVATELNPESNAQPAVHFDPRAYGQPQNGHGAQDARRGQSQSGRGGRGRGRGGNAQGSSQTQTPGQHQGNSGAHTQSTGESQGSSSWNHCGQPNGSDGRRPGGRRGRGTYESPKPRAARAPPTNPERGAAWQAFDAQVSDQRAADTMAENARRHAAEMAASAQKPTITTIWKRTVAGDDAGSRKVVGTQTTIKEV